MSEEVEKRACENCRKMIDVIKIDLHENYCKKNVVKCNKCDEFINKSEMEEHE